MVLLPILLLISASVVIWLLRKRHPRIHWFVASFGALLAWVATYLLGDQLPIELEFSIWRPKALFPEPINFLLDDTTWPLVMSISAILLLIALTKPARDEAITIREHLTLFVYTCISLAAVLAGNILSVVTMWMLMDVFIFALSMRNSREMKKNPRLFWWNAKNLSSIFLLIVASALNSSLSGGQPFHGQMVAGSVVIVVIASLLRTPIPNIASYGENIGWEDSGSVSTLELFPVITGVSLLAHVFKSGIPEDAVLWLRLIGGACLIYSMFNYYSHFSEKLKTLDLYIGIFGIGILVASYGSTSEMELLSAFGVLIVSLSATLNFLRIHENWHHAVPFLFAAMLTGLPGTSGGIISVHIAEEVLNSGIRGIEILIWIGLGLLTQGFVRSTFRYQDQWKNSENLTRTSYSLGLMLFVVNTFLIGYQIHREITVGGILFSISVGLLTGIIYFGITKMRSESALRLRRKLDLSGLLSNLNFIRFISKAIYDILYGAGRIFEGDTGMLWTFVILQLLVIALGKIGL